MSDLRDLVIRWQRGWGAARALPAATDVGGGLRVHCRQPTRDVEYFALDPAALTSLAGLVAREDTTTWLTVPTHDPQEATATLRAAGLTLLRSGETLMSTDLRDQPRTTPAAGYRLREQTETGPAGVVVRVTAVDGTGDVAAHGTMALTGPDAVADKILTVAEHQRRGLGSAVMSALTRSALDHGATRGLLIASEQGRRLYTRLGWRTEATVLISGGDPDPRTGL